MREVERGMQLIETLDWDATNNPQKDKDVLRTWCGGYHTSGCSWTQTILAMQ